MDIEHFLQYEKNRQTAYQLLATCFSLPENGMSKITSDLEEILRRLAPEAAEHIAPMRSNLSIDDLKVDHAALFIGPFKLLAPPYGSVYLEGSRQIMGNSTIDTRNRYLKAGLQVADDFKEAPDHVSIELEFMSFLVFKEINALSQDDFEDARHQLSNQDAFLKDHLGAWIAEFAQNVENNAQTSFYKNLAIASHLFVERDHTNISDVSIATLNALATIA
jgi:TorA maturation chaperone TorD